MDGPAITTVGLVVSTLGRSDELGVMLDSLVRQTRQPDAIVIVDQNKDDRLMPVIARYEGRLPIQRLVDREKTGVSRGRNLGWRALKTDVIAFPDDDCWYPETFIAQALALLQKTEADMVFGRCADETGRNVNGRFEAHAQWIDRRNVWTTGIEWMGFFKRSALEASGGFDETIGPGANTPFGAGEGQDVMLKVLQHGRRGFYDPALVGHHAEHNVVNPTPVMRAKVRGYARGHGRVMRLNGFGVGSLAYWTVRPFARAALALAQGRVGQATLAASVAMARVEGYFQPTPKS